MNNIIDSNQYLSSISDYDSLKRFKQYFNKNIKPDGVRSRAYLKLVWSRKTNQIKIAESQSYFQNKNSNCLDGGKVRDFSVMDKKILNLKITQNIIKKNLKIIKDFKPLEAQDELIFGLHFIRYTVDKYGASYSSPDGFHRDDEPLVFIHLIGLTKNALGGDNLISDLKSKEIKHVLRLEHPMDTLYLTRDYYHAVTPLGSKHGNAKRDVLLFTVEPYDTQVVA